mmetsp:Transcript_47235/g.113299  ORF Transcript_47235/g.113299 Transcript_47235/m.113299 type:complete len:229 (-) Transcript_47235:295-981(-)
MSCRWRSASSGTCSTRRPSTPTSSSRLALCASSAGRSRAASSTPRSASTSAGSGESSPAGARMRTCSSCRPAWSRRASSCSADSGKPRSRKPLAGVRSGSARATTGLPVSSSRTRCAGGSLSSAWASARSASAAARSSPRRRISSRFLSTPSAPATRRTAASAARASPRSTACFSARRSRGPASLDVGRPSPPVSSPSARSAAWCSPSSGGASIAPCTRLATSTTSMS